MASYRAPLADLRFLLEAFDYSGRVHSLEKFADFGLETAFELLEGYAKYCVDVLVPLNEPGDRAGVAFDPETGSVTMPEGFKEAYDGFCEHGFTALANDPEHGGIGAPFCIGTMAEEVRLASNKSFSMCPGLTESLVLALESHGTNEQKAFYLPKLISGEWSGTMCLTEPQCGTDLGLMTTKAEVEGDHYRLTGTKVWITFGEHDMSKNIVHLVLARLPDAPPGIKGISSFIVPKFLPNGERNTVACSGTDHKLGINASPTCVMNLEGAHGWLVGEPNRGMRAMFTMMNAARLMVGLEGVALGEAAYQSALEFALDRRQSRALDPAKREEGEAADNILVHPDVRRMLLSVKSTNEALRGLAIWISMHYDQMYHHPDEAVRETASDTVALLIPIMKSYGSARGFQNVSEAMQVMGGAGYTEDWPVEQHLRDVRISMIYEGTNHIQALDLVGRKLPMKGGRLVKTFESQLLGFMESCQGIPEMAEFLAPLGAEAKRLGETTRWLAVNAMQDPEVVGAVANNYLQQFALVVLGYIWTMQIKAALERPEGDRLRRAKLQTARYFFQLELPAAEHFSNLVRVGKAPITEIDIDLL